MHRSIASLLHNTPAASPAAAQTSSPTPIHSWGTGGGVAPSGVPGSAAMPTGGFTFGAVLPSRSIPVTMGAPNPIAMATAGQPMRPASYGLGASGAPGLFSLTSSHASSQAVPVQPSADVNKTAPRMQGSFNLYRAQLTAFLQRFNAWGMLDGTLGRPVMPGPDQQHFDSVDVFVRDTILRGVKTEDAERLCDLTSGRQMWLDLEAHYTKREFSNYVWVLKKFFHATYTREQTMDSWLQEIHDTRRELANLGRVIDDDLTVDVILMGVVQTHREVVRQFSRVMTPGGRPTLAQVMNTLKAETELDELVRDQTEGAAPKVLYSDQKKSATSGESKNGGGAPSTGKSKKRRKGKCHYCGIAGHYQRECRKLMFDLKHGNVDEAKLHLQQGGNGGKNGGGKNGSGKGGKKPASPIGMIRPAGDDVTSLTGAVCSSSAQELYWILDSGAKTHTCGRRELMLKLPHHVEKDVPHESWTGEITTEHVVADLPVKFLQVENQKGRPCSPVPVCLSGARNVPGCRVNLLSLKMMEEAGWRSEHQYPVNAPWRWLLRKGTATLVFSYRNGYYRAQTSLSLAAVIAHVDPREDSLMRWHLRFAHVNAPALQKLVRDGHVTGMTLSAKEQRGQVADCLTCTLAKSRRMSYRNVLPDRSISCCEKLMSDSCYYGERSVGGCVLFQLVQDEYSRYVWGFLLQHKSQCAANLKTLFRQLRQRGLLVRFLGSDQGPKFLNEKVKAVLREEGISPASTNAYTPEENALVEKMNGVVLRSVRTMLTATGLPSSLWGEAFKFALFVINRSPSKAIQGRTPYELLEGKKPDVSLLRVWGCAATYFIPKQKRKRKSEPTAREALFLGNPTSTTGFRVMDLVTGTIVESRNVSFREQWGVDGDYVGQLLLKAHGGHRDVTLPTPIPYVELPIHTYSGSSSGQAAARPSSDTAGPVGNDTSSQKRRRDSDSDEEANGNTARPASKRCRTEEPAPSDVPCDLKRADPATRLVDESMYEETESDDEVKPASPKRKPGLVEWKQNPGLVEYRGKCNKKSRGAGQKSQPVRRSTRLRRSNVRLHGYAVENYFVATTDELPKSAKAALESPDRDKWMEAMQAEFESIKSNETWILVNRPANKKVLTSRWVFVIKRNEQGEIERYKARLTIRGFEQAFGLDYWEVFAPVVSMEAIRVVFVLAFLYNLNCYHIDFTTAFLNGFMDVEVYMEQPEPFRDGSGWVCLLKKSLYGLKQSPLIWNATLKAFLLELGFEVSVIAEGIYVKWINGVPIFLAVYVDDVVIAAKPEHAKWLIEELSAKFKLKDLGIVSNLLAMSVDVQTDAVKFSQEVYIRHLLKRFDMEGVRVARTPMDMKAKPACPANPYDSTVNRADLPYRQLVGSLNYLVRCTRPDIANAVMILAKFMSCDTEEHFDMARRAMGYLKGTASYGLVFRREATTKITITGFADADLGNDPDTRRSVSGCVVKMNGCVVAYQNKVQKNTVRDTCSAELTAASACAYTVRWLQNLVVELGVPLETPSLILSDNEAAIQVMTHSSGHHKKKCLDLDIYKVIDYVSRGFISIKHLASALMPADALTKPLGKNKFRQHRRSLGVECLSTEDEDQGDSE